METARGRADRHHLHRGRAGADDAQLARGRVGEVDDALAFAHEGPAVVDAHVDRALRLQVAHPHERPERQRAVGGGERVHVVDLPARGALAVEVRAVPGGQPLLTEAGGVRDGLVPAAEDLVGPRLPGRGFGGAGDSPRGGAGGGAGGGAVLRDVQAQTALKTSAKTATRMASDRAIRRGMSGIVLLIRL